MLHTVVVVPRLRFGGSSQLAGQRWRGLVLRFSLRSQKAMSHLSSVSR